MRPMAGRIVVFGATGYTGRLTAEALVRARRAPGARRPQPRSGSRSWPPSWAASRRGRGRRAARVGAASWSRRATCWSRRSALSCAAGTPAAEAAIANGAHYLDSTGEPPFIREVFERYGPACRARRQSGMLTAFGYDWVPGNLAGALALERAGDDADARRHRLLLHRRCPDGMSGGTRASLVGAVAAPSYRLARRADRDRARRPRAARTSTWTASSAGRLGRCVRELRAAARSRRSCAR